MSLPELTRSFAVPGFELAWDVFGDAPGSPLVLVHGYTGSAHDFATHIDSLAEHRRVFTIDHRGHGRSTNSGDPETYTIDHIVDDLVAWTSEVVAPDGTPFDLLGHSMGGRVAIRYALARRDLVRSLVLFSTTAWTFGPPDPEMREMILLYLNALRPGRPLPRAGAVPEDALIEATAPSDWQVRKAELRAATDTMAAQALGIALFDDGLEQVDHRLGDIDCPTTVVAGEHDHPYVDDGPRLRDSITDARFIPIAGAYHSAQLTHPVEWRAAIDAHLARVD
ncbi:MAG: alpha/beta hydrolase [Actinomycetota bacterium]